MPVIHGCMNVWLIFLFTWSAGLGTGLLGYGTFPQNSQHQSNFTILSKRNETSLLWAGALKGSI